MRMTPLAIIGGCSRFRVPVIRPRKGNVELRPQVTRASTLSRGFAGQCLRDVHSYIGGTVI